MKDKTKPEDILREYLKKLGRKGGLARAKRHSKKQLREWAKLGGRPKGAKKQKEV